MCLKIGIDIADRQETLEHRAAVSRSAEAMDKLVGMEWPEDLAEVVSPAQSRVKDVEARKLDRRDQKKAAMVGRG